MRTMPLLCLLLFVSLSASSQLTKGTWLAGGTGSFASTKNSYSSNTYNSSSDIVDIRLSPSAGYFILNKLPVGLRLSYTKYKLRSRGGERAIAQKGGKSSLFINPGIGFLKPITPAYSQNSTPFMVNVRLGKFIEKNLSIGLEANVTQYRADFNRAPSFGGTSAVVERGTIKDNSFSVGVSIGHHSQLTKRVWLVTNVYVHYLDNQITGNSALLDNQGIEVLTLTTTEDKRYFLRAGLNAELHYIFSPTWAASFRLAQADLRFRKGQQKLYFEAPLLIGVSHHFKL